MKWLHKIKWYSLIGVFNTALHFAVFSVLSWQGVASAWANVAAFACAATFSFFANAKWTFKQTANQKRYFLFMSLMGGLALLTGWLTDYLGLSSILAAISFSLISWVLGFLSSQYIIFK
ncbi:GtrA family protein [Kingella negevensis]|uniref:GtrA family protein n=1 Tax=Kingella negevensis TaxID=1522312 RepID=UPI00050A0622|nr:GtrA family protein [Kingella negevensis]MDK4689033.1 GtrA family protein [Kingella negevensis]WII90620.1 GtrA family protein [Kingella negevensis]